MLVLAARPDPVGADQGHETATALDTTRLRSTDPPDTARAVPQATVSGPTRLGSRGNGVLPPATR